MSKTTVALFDNWAEAEQAVKELVGAGIPRDDISIVANRAKCGPEIGPVSGIGAEGRVGAGMAVGGSAGLVAGILALAIPGIGPVLAAGPLAAGLVGAGIGAAAGGAIGALTEAGVPEQDAGCYCEAVRRGGIVVTVASSDEDAARVADLMGRHRSVDLDDCVEEWQQSGWKGFDPNGEPVATAEEEAAPARPAELPFNPDGPRQRKERREARAVRSYVRVR